MRQKGSAGKFLRVQTGQGHHFTDRALGLEEVFRAEEKGWATGRKGRRLKCDPCVGGYGSRFCLPNTGSCLPSSWCLGYPLPTLWSYWGCRS